LLSGASCSVCTGLAISSPFTSTTIALNSFRAGYQIVTSITGYTSSYTLSTNTSDWTIIVGSFRPTRTGTAPTGGVRHRSQVY
jgi:hypothetical protein